MSDPLSTSRTARESLARGLNALQADPTVPSHLVDLAAPIAQAMGALHQLERTNQLAPHADVALNHVRGAMAQLQAGGGGHPAVNAALDHVAQSLTLVHTLSLLASGAPMPPPPPVTRPNTAGMPARPPLAVPMTPGQPMAPMQPGQPMAPMQPHAPVMQPPPPPPMQQRPPPPMQQRPPPAMHQPPPMQAMQPPMQAPPPPMFPQTVPSAHGYGAPPPQATRDPFAAPTRDPFAAPARDPFAAGAPPPQQPATPSMPVPAPPPQGNAAIIAAELGAHSPTNFYKGLAGNDIIDHGGLFVSTYVSPKIGTPIRLKVSLPGGYEFEANAVVQWTREQGGDAPPGFGARFTGIAPEARQLVYRYVRNREPMFYDDL